MKITVLLFWLLIFSANIYSKDKTITEGDGSLKTNNKIEQLVQQYLRPKAVLNSFYNDFKFSSNKGARYNTYSGHTNFISAGGDNFKIKNKYYWGLNAYKISTQTKSNSNLSNFLSQSNQSLENTGLYLHLMKEIFSPFFIDVFANLGQDKFNLANTVNVNGFSPLTGYSKYYGNDQTIGARTFLGQVYNQFIVQGDLTYFYSTYHQSDYIIAYPGQNLAVKSLTTKIGTLVEHARVYYKVNKYFSPFLNGNLLQIVSRTYSRPLLEPNLLTTGIPDLTLGKYGYSYGAGVEYHYKDLRIIPIYVHAVRGSTYADNFVGITLELSGLG